MGSRVCPDCGAYLDPGERCDCQDEKEAAPVVATQEAAMDKTSKDIVTPIGGEINANN